MSSAIPINPFLKPDRRTGTFERLLPLVTTHEHGLENKTTELLGAVLQRLLPLAPGETDLLMPLLHDLDLRPNVLENVSKLQPNQVDISIEDNSVAGSRTDLLLRFAVDGHVAELVLELKTQSRMADAAQLSRYKSNSEFPENRVVASLTPDLASPSELGVLTDGKSTEKGFRWLNFLFLSDKLYDVSSAGSLRQRDAAATFYRWARYQWLYSMPLIIADEYFHEPFTTHLVVPVRSAQAESFKFAHNAALVSRSGENAPQFLEPALYEITDVKRTTLAAALTQADAWHGAAKMLAAFIAQGTDKYLSVTEDIHLVRLSPHVSDRVVAGKTPLRLSTNLGRGDVRWLNLQHGSPLESEAELLEALA